MKSSLFREKKPELPIPSREGKLAMFAIRRQERPLMKAELQKLLGSEPSSKEVENALDFLIQKLKDNGVLREIIGEYLAMKIAEERARGGAPSKS